MIRPVTPADAQQLLDIYSYYILNTTSTTEEIPPTAEEMARRVSLVTTQFPWFVEERDGKILGYSYALSFRSRTAWHRTAEVSVYVHPKHCGQKIATHLYSQLFRRLKETTDIHVLIACIVLPNEASVRLHEHFGFLQKALLKEVGFKFGCWMDIGLWHRIL